MTSPAGWTVYMLRCSDSTLYTGIAKDLALRLAAHRRGVASRYTRTRLPVALVYEERQPDRGAALRREAELKRLARREKLALLLARRNAPGPPLAAPGERVKIEPHHLPAGGAMQSKAATVAQYLAELPPDRRAAISAVRKMILANLDRDYEEGMQYGMIGYYVPHRVFPDGYHCDPQQPLPFAGLASQKNYMSVYIMSAYGEGLEEKWLREAWAKTGKKLDMGKCCIRFKKVEDLALDVLGQAIRRVPAKSYIAHYVSTIRTMSKSARKKAAKKKAAPRAKTTGSRRTPAARRTTSP